MQKRFLAILVALVAALPAAIVMNPVTASPNEQYSGANFGDGNLPAGCVRDSSAQNAANICHHMKTGLNALDSPQVDVLVMVPASPTAERDMRIMRQSVEMWEGGIDYLADEMGLGWLADGVDFHITVDAFDPTGSNGGELTTYPIVDPEIVVIATNPVGGAGIGVDPVNLGGEVEAIFRDEPVVFTSEDRVPCHSVQNPLDFEYWENLPGFDSHHGGRSGTYTEDCGGAGGNICFAVNGGIDPAPGAVDLFSLFDLVSHEFGHCLTLGHVGDGLDGAWSVVPTNDIMAYDTDPPGLNKCVSTLDVEAFAVRMSRYLDVDGNGAVEAADRLEANDQVGIQGSPAQVQHPDDHLYASGTGRVTDCPQPDLGLVPGARVDWTPTPVDVEPTPPTSVSHDDADDDAGSPVTEILAVDAEVTATHVVATIHLDELWPNTSVASPTSYSLTVDGRRFDSFVRYAIDPNPMTWDNEAGAYMPSGTSTWDLAADTVTYRIPRSYLSAAAITSPYEVTMQANVGLLTTASADDVAPDAGRLAIAG